MAYGAKGSALGTPARGTRPANRRQLILAAASDLLYRKGYSSVGMGEVADAVAIGPSALYRHFRGKQDLLAAVVVEALDGIASALDTTSADDMADLLALAALEHRTVGVLWWREARHLSDDSRAMLRSTSHRIVARLAELIGERHPELPATEANLLAHCALAVGNSVSFHNLSLPEPEFSRLLGELVTAAVDATIRLPEDATPPDAHAGLTITASRREVILVAAAKLFARNGFAGVSMDDIGAAVGIAGPSIYNHFHTKTDILVAAVFRGDEWLRIDMRRAFARATDPADGLHRLLLSYAAFVAENPELVQLLISETIHLPADARHRARESQHTYIDEWVTLLRRVHPDWDPTTARLRVQAAQTVLNDIALTPRLITRPGVSDAVVTICVRLLAL
ncbi:TetR/AcrR family transcriptional regulator [Nocardia sp. NPDC059239]|uniref:TetR/AcrR family transcriptional regulator n=1 Tax=unclassified Nocardia TaxID=2637762 RepID=UPI00367D9187